MKKLVYVMPSVILGLMCSAQSMESMKNSEYERMERLENYLTQNMGMKMDDFICLDPETQDAIRNTCFSDDSHQTNNHQPPHNNSNSAFEAMLRREEQMHKEAREHMNRTHEKAMRDIQEMGEKYLKESRENFEKHYLPTNNNNQPKEFKPIQKHRENLETHSVFEFEIPSHDYAKTGFTIPGIFIKNQHVGFHPTLFYIHGGPHASFVSKEKDGESDMSEMIQVAQLLNINVVGFDYRGSCIGKNEVRKCTDGRTFNINTQYQHVAQGYLNNKTNSQNYEDSVKNNYGGDHLTDIKTVYDYIKGNYSDCMDNKKNILGGHSFGGFATAVALMHPELKKLFNAGILMSGFYNIPTNQQDVVHKEPGSGGYTFQQKCKIPMNYAQDITVPILVVHGKKDELDWTGFKQSGVENFVKNYNSGNKYQQANVLYFATEKHDYEDKNSWELIAGKTLDLLNRIG